MITIVGKDNCPYCVKAKLLCELSGLDYDYEEVGKDLTKEQLLEKFSEEVRPSIRTVPQIWVNGNHVGGFTEFSEWVSATIP